MFDFYLPLQQGALPLQHENNLNAPAQQGPSLLPNDNVYIVDTFPNPPRPK